MLGAGAVTADAELDDLVDMIEAQVSTSVWLLLLLLKMIDGFWECRTLGLASYLCALPALCCVLQAFSLVQDLLSFLNLNPALSDKPVGGVGGMQQCSYPPVQQKLLLHLIQCCVQCSVVCVPHLF